MNEDGWPSMMRDVEDRAAELFLQWTNGYVIDDFTELKEQIQEFRDKSEAHVKYMWKQRLFGAR